MCAGTKVAVLLSSFPLLLIFSVAANAKTCVWVDYENSPAATVSGRITTHHKLPKGTEQRTGGGPWLILDHRLRGGLQGVPENRHLAPRGSVCDPKCRPDLATTLAAIARPPMTP